MTDLHPNAIGVNKRADMILLEVRSPLENVHNIRTVKYVVANGVITIYPTAKLSNQLI